MTINQLKQKAKETGALITKRDDGNYRIKYGYKNGVTYVSGLKCYVCNKSCIQAWTSWKQNRKATCTRECMDRGMFHDKQHLHDGKWWDKYSNYKGYMCRKRKDPITGKVVKSRRHQDNFKKHYGRPQYPGYQLHHINMCKTDDDISNLAELTPKKHQELHTTYNEICKELMELGIVSFNPISGYYINKKE